MSQQELADLAGTTQPTINRLEKGETKLTKEWATRLALHLNVAAVTLLFGEEMEQSNGEANSSGLFGNEDKAVAARATIMNEEIRKWVGENMRERRMSQTVLADIIGISQSAMSTRLLDGTAARPFKIEEIENLERYFDKPSPVRFGPGVSSNLRAIDPFVLQGVIKHLATHYPKIIRADAATLAEAIVDLCEYVQNTPGRELTGAESRLAMKRVKILPG